MRPFFRRTAVSWFEQDVVDVAGGFRNGYSAGFLNQQDVEVVSAMKVREPTSTIRAMERGHGI